MFNLENPTMPRGRFRGQVQPREGIRASILVPEPVGGEATLRLYDPIDSWGGEWGVSAKEFVGALDMLDADRLTLHINSPGGEVYEGITMLNALRQHRATVTAVVDGIAASAASFLAAGADRVVMAPNSQMMIHDAWGMGIGNAADLRGLADTLDKISDNIASIYAGKAGGTLQGWRATMMAEAWYSADEAVAAGLADEVLASPADQEAAAAAAFDLSVFRHEGREAAGPPPSPAAREDLARRRVTLARRRLEAVAR